MGRWWWWNSMKARIWPSKTQGSFFQNIDRVIPRSLKHQENDPNMKQQRMIPWGWALTSRIQKHLSPFKSWWTSSSSSSSSHDLYILKHVYIYICSIYIFGIQGSSLAHLWSSTSPQKPLPSGLWRTLCHLLCCLERLNNPWGDGNPSDWTY